MLKNSENSKPVKQRTKQYDFIDGLHFLYVFSYLHHDEQFDLDDKTKDILSDAAMLAKTEYDNKALASLDTSNTQSVLELALDEEQQYKSKIDKMTKQELKELTKTSYSFAKKILRKIESPVDLPANPASEEIREITWQLFFAESKKEQDALFDRQSKLFAKEDEINKKNERMLDGQIKSCVILSTSLANAQYTYSYPVKSIVEKIKTRISGDKTTTEEK